MGRLNEYSQEDQDIITASKKWPKSRLNIHPTHKMTEWRGTVVTLINTPRFGEIRKCEYCDHEHARTVCGEDCHHELLKPCEFDPGLQLLEVDDGAEEQLIRAVEDAGVLANPEDFADQLAECLREATDFCAKGIITDQEPFWLTRKLAKWEGTLHLFNMAKQESKDDL